VARDLFKFERALWRNKPTIIAGTDEAGRGPLAGPVTAAAVIFPGEWLDHGLPKDFKGLNDSKQLPEERREYFFQALTSFPGIRYAVSHVEHEVIDAINILRASHRAMAQALSQLDPAPEHVLVDGLRVDVLVFPQTSIIEGDARSYSIAAASVLAKVSRDRLMLEYDRLYPGYGFAEHKGYATPQHFEAISLLGPCAIHRRSFAPFRPVQPELFPTEPA
jgi:ribonuclease HII